MAEAKVRDGDESRGQEDEVSSTNLDCPICLQPCVHPVELPCTHIFCFLCIKGVAMQGGQSRCAICRSNIPSNVLTHPRLKDISQLYKDPKLCGEHQWFYESRSGGWWQYEERTMAELERAYEAKLTTTQLLIAGHLYEIDFTQMLQYRVGNRPMSRRIKRDVPTAEKRGIAGLRILQPGQQAPPNIPPDNGSRRGRRRSGRGSGRNLGSTIHLNPGGQGLSISGGNQTSGTVTVSVQGQGTDSVDIVIYSSDDDDNDEVEEEEDEEEFEEDDDDDDMELGEEEENLESSDSSDEDEDEPRDGARAPTSRSDRSNSSVNPTPPPSSRNGASPGGNQPVTSATSNNNVSNPTSPIPVAPANRQFGDVEIEVNRPRSGINRTCVLVGQGAPSLRITLDFNHSVRDEIL